MTKSSIKKIYSKIFDFFSCAKSIQQKYLSTASSFHTSTAMAKSKNHTGHNDNEKAHRNGIKKPNPFAKPKLKGLYKKFVTNSIFALKGNNKWGKNQEKLAAFKAKQVEQAKKDKAAPKVAPKKKAAVAKPAPAKTDAKPAAKPAPAKTDAKQAKPAAKEQPKKK